MTKILYNRAAKTFIDAISQGFDEHGAYDKVEKKHGKVLADVVWAEAQAEMKSMKKNTKWNGDTSSGIEKRAKRDVVGAKIHHWLMGYGNIIRVLKNHVIVQFKDGTTKKYPRGGIYTKHELDTMFKNRPLSVKEREYEKHGGSEEYFRKHPA